MNGVQDCPNEGPSLFARGGDNEFKKYIDEIQKSQNHRVNFNQTWHNASLVKGNLGNN